MGYGTDLSVILRCDGLWQKRFARVLLGSHYSAVSSSIPAVLVFSARVVSRSTMAASGNITGGKQFSTVCYPWWRRSGWHLPGYVWMLKYLK